MMSAFLWIVGGLILAHPQGMRAARFAAVFPQDAREWQFRARSRLYALLMNGSRPQKVGLDARVTARGAANGGAYRIEEVTFRSLPDRRVHAWVAVPAGARKRCAAVLALHGHGGTGEQVVRGEGLYWYGRALAQMGYVVIAPDIGQHDLQHPKWTLMGERVWDAIRCLDYLQSRPDVDGRRMAVCGLSLGGETAMYVAALDERVQAADCAGWLTTIQNMKQGHCPCWFVPGLEESFDYADIFACVAPRPLVCEIGSREQAPGGFPASIARGAFEEVLAAYRAYGAQKAAVLDIHPYGHVFVGRSFWPVLRAAVGSEPPWREEPAGSDAEALRRGEVARRCFTAALGVFHGWWRLKDASNNLYPRRVDQAVWAPNDNAADMLPFLFLTAYFLEPPRLPDLLATLASEERLTTRDGGLPDWWSLSTHRWVYPAVDKRRLIFNAAEYCKDGLIPMTEVMGPGPWTERMVRLMDAIFNAAPVESGFGRLPADDTEVNGEVLQVLSRLYSLTRQEKYWTWARRIADAYCKEMLPASGWIPCSRWDFARHRPLQDDFSLNDHGNEVAMGLAEFYVMARSYFPAAAEEYRVPLARMYHRLLDVARNEDGFWVNRVRAASGRVLDPSPPDTWGYALGGAVAFGMASLDSRPVEAARTALGNLSKPQYLDWAGGADSFADAIESGLLLLNRLPVAEGFRWLDEILLVFLAKQQEDGIVEGWYGDGNFARTALMAGLWCTQGFRVAPWRKDLKIGAVPRGTTRRIVLAADEDWQGVLAADSPRHRLHLHLPLNYPRLNEFPEWFAADPQALYRVRIGRGEWRIVSGLELARGIPVRVRAGRCLGVTVAPVKAVKKRGR